MKFNAQPLGYLRVLIIGSGRVTSNPTGIDCRTDCTGHFALGTVVTLTPSADDGWYFLGWHRACEGQGGCTLMITGSHEVHAVFLQP